VARPASPAEPEAKARILLDGQTVRMFPGLGGEPVVEVTHHRQIEILRPEAEDLAQVDVSYQPELSQVVSIEGRTIAPDGHEKTFGADDATDVQIMATPTVQTDSRDRHLSLRPTAPGALVEYRWTQRIKSWRLYKFKQLFAAQHPAELIRFEVVAPTDWTIDYVARLFERDIDFPPTVSTASGLKHWVWERRQVPAVSHEPYAPSLDEAAPLVMVRLRAAGDKAAAPPDPAKLSAWFHTWTRPPSSHDAAPLAKRLTEGVPDDPERLARRLFAWVRDEITYYGVEIGIGGFRAHGADEVLRLRYGDCKDKANLLHELLAGVGIPSRLVLLYAHDGLPRELRLPTGDSFNHAILEVQLPQRTLLVDPTSPTAAFGELPDGDQGADALPIDEAGAPVQRIPRATAEANAQSVRLELTRLGDDLVGRVSATEHGSASATVRSLLMKTAHNERSIAAARLLGLHHGQLDELVVDGERPSETPTPVGLAAQVRFDHAAAGRDFLLRLGDLLEPLVPSIPAGRRALPMVLHGGARIEQQVRLRLSSMAVRSTPPAVHIDEPMGVYDLSFTREEGALVIARRIELREHLFTPSEVPAVRSFFDRILAAETRAVAVHLVGENP
jgi:transglutaminase-like putative cysteine protease